MSKRALENGTRAKSKRVVHEDEDEESDSSSSSSSSSSSAPNTDDDSVDDVSSASYEALLDLVDKDDAEDSGDEYNDEEVPAYPAMVVVAVDDEDGATQRIYRIPAGKKSGVADLRLGELVLQTGPAVQNVRIAAVLASPDHPYAPLAARVGIGRDDAEWARFGGELDMGADVARMVAVIYFTNV